MVTMNDRKQLPAMPSEEAERDFWADHDSTEYVDWSRAERVVFPNLQGSTRTSPSQPPPARD